MFVYYHKSLLNFESDLLSSFQKESVSIWANAQIGSLKELAKLHMCFQDMTFNELYS